jgi:hypothetical protein
VNEKDIFVPARFIKNAFTEQGNRPGRILLQRQKRRTNIKVTQRKIKNIAGFVRQRQEYYVIILKTKGYSPFVVARLQFFRSQ